MSTITLFVNRVRCADETTGKYREKFGNDEIYLGAVYVGISADRSFDIRVVRTKEVYAHFDDKETVEWNRPLFTFDLGDPAVHRFPKAVLTSLVLAEHDAGNGRNDFLDTVAQQFRDKLTAAAIDGVANRAMAEAGVSPGGGERPGGVIGGGGRVIDRFPDLGRAGPAVLAAASGGAEVRDHRGETGPAPRRRPRPTDGGAPPIVRDHRGDTSGGVVTPSASETPPTAADPFVVSALKDWGKDQLKKIADEALKTGRQWIGDDVFPARLLVLDVPTADHTWNGSPDTSEEISEFVAHDGKYHVWSHWQLRA